MTISKNTRQFILEQEPDICCFCNDGPREEDEWTLDHKVPKCFGGGDGRSNLRKAHLSCNRLHGAKLHAWLLVREHERLGYPDFVFDPAEYERFVYGEKVRVQTGSDISIESRQGGTDELVRNYLSESH